MNILATTRLGANIALAGFLTVFTAMLIIGGSVDLRWVWAAGALAIAGSVAQFAVSVLRPRAIATAWDEQSVAAHRGSYQFGYWTALMGFWGLIILVHMGRIEPMQALIILGPVLAAAPSLWMIGASWSGRAG